MPEARAHWPEIVRGLRTRGVEDALAISALTGEGVDVLLRRVVATLAEMPVPRALPSEMGEPERAVIGPPEDKSFSISRDAKGVWHVRGAYIEKIVAMTKWDYYQAVMRFQRIMEALGITQALRDAGVREGDTVQIGEMQLDWSD
jgi:GTP-binding protein